MADASAAFVGKIPENYDRYLGPVIFEPFAKDLAERLGKAPSKNVLETACGTGIVTRHLLKVLAPGAGLIATDLNPAMLDHARAAIGDDSRISWEVADMCDLNFESETFDALVCQFGIMFAPDKAAAFREAHRVLEQGGRFLFNVWDEIGKNPFAKIANDTIASFFPNDPPTFYETPFGFRDREMIAKMLEAAGFSSIAVSIVSKPSQAPSAADFARGLIEGNPVRNEIQARGTASLEEVESELAARLKKNLGDRPVPVRLQAIVFEAKAQA